MIVEPCKPGVRPYTIACMSTKTDTPTSTAKRNIQARVNIANLSRLDELATERRWTRSEMVDWLIEQHVKENTRKPAKSR